MMQINTDNKEPVAVASPTIITVNICITWLPIETTVVLATSSNCPAIVNKKNTDLIHLIIIKMHNNA